MKLPAYKLNGQLQQGLAPIYWISGDEPLQHQEACDAIRARCRAAGIEEREVMAVEPGFQWQQLLDAGASLSLFASQRLLELRINGNKLGREGSEVIRQYCQRLAQHPEDGDVLLVTSGKLDASQMKSAWMKAVDQAGVTVQVWPIEAARLPRWIAERAQQAGLQLEPQAGQLLAERVEGNMLAAAQEIEKLALLTPAGERLDADTLLSRVQDASRHTVFDLADTLLQGDANKAARVLRGLRGEGIEPPILLWAITRELRQIISLVHRLDEGQPLATICQQLKIWEKRRPLYQQASQRLKLSQLHQLLAQAGRLDDTLKGGGTRQDIEEGLLSLCMGLCGISLAG